MKRNLRLLALILAFMMLMPLNILATGDTTLKSAEAESFKLKKTDGEVKILNAAGKEIKLRDGADLKSGYKISTKESYAYLSLDSEKLIKLDWNTTVSLRKKGKKLEVLLDEGTLFYSVNKPLEKDETLDIRTSTISTGIRGTMGIISVESKIDDNGGYIRLTSGGLLEGVVEMGYYDESSDEIKVVTLNAGDFFKAISSPTTKKGVPYVQSTTITTSPLAGIDLLKEFPMVIEDIANDPDLIKRVIDAPNGIDKENLDKLIDEGPQLLEKKQEEDRKRRDEEEKRVLDAIEDLRNDENKPNIIPVFEKEPSKPAVVPKPPVVPEVKEEPQVPKKEEKPPAEEEEEEDSGSGGGGSTPTPPPPPAKKEFTVTFLYNGKTFATCKVLENEKVSEPVLMPTPKGDWIEGNTKVSYDFTKPVTADMELIWM